MKCPACGDYHAAHVQKCHCGYDLIPKALKPRPADERETTQPLASAEVRSQELRSCAKCGSLMYMYLCEEMYLNGFIPSGKRFYFRCAQCQKEIKIRSPWRFSLLIWGSVSFAVLFWFLYPFSDSRIAIFILISAPIPLTFLLECIVRVRYRPVKRAGLLRRSPVNEVDSEAGSVLPVPSRNIGIDSSAIVSQPPAGFTPIERPTAPKPLDGAELAKPPE
jgi:hypothetical protein